MTRNVQQRIDVVARRGGNVLDYHKVMAKQGFPLFHAPTRSSRSEIGCTLARMFESGPPVQEDGISHLDGLYYELETSQ